MTTRLPAQLSRLPADRLRRVAEALEQLQEAGFSEITNLGLLQTAVHSKLGNCPARIPEEDLTSEYTGMCLWAWTPKRWFQETSRTAAMQARGAKNEATNETAETIELAPIADKVQAKFDGRIQKMSAVAAEGRLGGPTTSDVDRFRGWFESMKKADAELRSFVTLIPEPKQAGDGPSALFSMLPSSGGASGRQELPKALDTKRKTGTGGYCGGKTALPMKTRGSVMMLHIGDSGCSTGLGSWGHIMSDHQLDGDGRPKDGTFYGRSSIHFAESVTGRYVPRAIFAGSESDLGPLHAAKIFAPTSLLQAAGNGNFGEGRMDSETVEKIFDCTRMQMEQADYGLGFIITHAVGEDDYLSGVLVQLLQRISAQYGKKHKFTVTGVPSPAGDALSRGRSALSEHALMEHVDVATFYDQSAVAALASSKYGLGVASPGQDQISNLVGRVARGLTGPLRFAGSVPANEGSSGGRGLNSLATNLVPYPRIHFMLAGLGGITSEAMSDFNIDGVRGYVATGQASSIGSLSSVLTPASRRDAKTIAMSLLCRGVHHYASMSKVMETKADRDYKFVNWSPSGFSISCFEDSASKKLNPEVVCLENNVNVREVFSSWQAGMDTLEAAAHGIEQGEKQEISEELSALCQDYQEVAADRVQEDEEEEEEE